MPVDHDVVELVREFVTEKVLPVASEFEARGTHPWVFGQQLAELGVLGAGLPEEYGGSSLNEATRVRIVEEIAYAWASLAATTTQQWVTTGMISTFGTEEQKARWLAPLAEGKVIASISLSEPGAGSDTSALQCRADRDGDSWVLNGTKTWVTNGSRADLIVLAARTPEGISAFIVEPDRTVACGTMTIGRPFDKLGFRSSDTVEIGYVDHRIPGDRLLGGEPMLGRGQHAFLNRIDLGRLHVGAIGLGIARAALDRSLEYSRRRVTFGKPIGDHQAMAFKLAGMALEVKKAQVMLDHAADTYDTGADAGLVCSMAKVACSEAALDATREALRVHGGIGYMSELPIERFFRDAPLAAIGEGTNEIQHIVIARHLKNLGTMPR